MSEQPLNLRSAVRILRRYRAVVGIVTALGLLVGACFTVAFNRPMHASNALVVLPSTITTTGTQLVIADSGPVLQNALPDITPTVSAATLRSRIQVQSVGSDVLSFMAQGDSPAQAQSMANAVADSYVAYVGTANNPVGWVPARLLAPAANATATELPVRAAVTGFIGALVGMAVGAVGALAAGRRNRKLRERGAIADAIGVPVLASVAVPLPGGSAAWISLLDRYEPAAADAWRLRHALGDLGLGGATPPSGRTSLTVLSLSSDPRALALGPQLALLAAADGIPTTLFIGAPDSSAVAARRSAATASPGTARSGRLRLAVADHDDLGRPPDSALSVAVCVVDDQAPRVTLPMRTDATWLAVSSGAATPEQLARVAASAAASGRRIIGILVADPDPADPTSGRVPQLARSPHGHMPNHLTGTLR
jgi:capsular polysaccharide biosynthesis protein